MKAEILSPCGSFDSLPAVLRTGCDAVYAGAKSFSARNAAENFTDEQITKAVRLCHKCGVKFYQAVNTLLFDGELPELMNVIKNACLAGVDGIITQDLAAVLIVKNCCPELELHASTQMSLHTPLGMDLAKKLGFSRAVAARELSLEQISKLCGRGIEIETFVHGALCMSFSGQCYMSAVIGSRSADRGRCAQACRLPFFNGLPEDGSGKNRNCLSLKDMSVVQYIPELEKAGVASLKIEGRMKRPEYAAAATDVCRKASDGEAYRLEPLRAVFSRSGFTDGYLTGKRSDMFGIRRKEDVTAAENVLPQLRELYRKERKVTDINFRLTAKLGEPLLLEASDGEGNSVSAKGSFPEKALTRPLTQEVCIKQLSRLGDTIYRFGSAKLLTDGEVSVSAAMLNSLRREVCKLMDEARISKNTKTIPFDETNISFDIKPKKRSNPPVIQLQLRYASQLELTDPELIDCVILPAGEILSCGELPKEKLVLSLPRYVRDEQLLEKELERLRSRGIFRGYASNLSHIPLLQKLGFEVNGGWELNITNSVALKVLKELGAVSAVLSPELKLSRISRIEPSIKTGVLVSGRLPLMLTVNCPIGDCQNCRGYISDRTGRKFPVKCEKAHGYTEILNSELLWLGDKQQDLNCDFAVMSFYDETPGQVRNSLELFLRGGKPKGNITRGLYYRGVL